ncbi:hypothetical protein [Muricoccus pecuniae]|uniref:Uncharacterized protein n=1 Tax=Muricoccus pecuniae TaxID=693023 RepID=A0A840XUW6_9PROT|nr:hypothetical protein [Roseomonas pecuniae]MBB5692518.1 hypothetical protein [Roseomonas pecuniae]
MISEDCLNVRLSDYLDRRREPNPSPPESAAEAAEEDQRAADLDAENR